MQRETSDKPVYYSLSLMGGMQNLKIPGREVTVWRKGGGGVLDIHRWLFSARAEMKGRKKKKDSSVRIKILMQRLIAKIYISFLSSAGWRRARRISCDLIGRKARVVSGKPLASTLVSPAKFRDKSLCRKMAGLPLISIYPVLLC